MLRAFGKVLRLPGRAWKAARRHPRLTLLLAAVLAAGAGAGFWGYAVHQWRAAQAALAQERPTEARDRLAFCLKVWSRSPEVHFLAARAARLAGDPDAAEAHLNRCLQLQGGATEAVQLEFLLLRVQTGEVDEVAPVLLDAVQKGHPEAPLILETLARAYIFRLRYRPAYACLSNWIEIRPEEARAYQWRGWVLERMNRHEAAWEDYDRALELAPGLVPVRVRVAEMHLEDMQAPEAEPHLERLAREVPDDPVVQARLGMCRFLQGRTEEARRLMEAAVVRLPKDPALLVSLAKLELQEGNGREAEARLRAVLAEDPSDTEALYVLASALQLQGRTEESAAVLEEYERKRELIERTNKLLQEAADSPTAGADEYAEIGEGLLVIGREKLGLYWLDRALGLDPGHQAAHRALAAYYERQGDAAMAA
ncbi:MAG TPA: tetratricopeptide repeat protein, partial [Gemmataceae bacterium]